MELLMKISMEWMQHVYWPQNQARLSHPWATKVTTDNFFDRNFGGAPAFKETLHFVEYLKKALIHLDSMLEPAACLFCRDWIFDQFHFSH